MDRVVKNLFLRLRDTFLAGGNLVVEVARNGLLRNFRDLVCADSPALDGSNPIVNRQFAVLLFLDKFVKVESLSVVSC